MNFNFRSPSRGFRKTTRVFRKNLLNNPETAGYSTAHRIGRIARSGEIFHSNRFTP